MSREKFEEDPAICLNCEKPVCDNCLEYGNRIKKTLTPEQLERKREVARNYYYRRKEREKKVV